MITYSLWRAWIDDFNSSWGISECIEKLIIIPFYIVLTPITIIVDIIGIPVELIVYGVIKYRDKRIDKDYAKLGGK